jgi:hypothetical protein
MRRAAERLPPAARDTYAETARPKLCLSLPREPENLEKFVRAPVKRLGSAGAGGTG